MANITITVQSLLNVSVYDSYTVSNTTTISSFKSTIQTNTGCDPSWFGLVFNNELITDETKTLAYYNIINGSVLRTANQIARLATLEDRQIAKLELAALDREASGNARKYYDLTELPTYYVGNTITDNPNLGGLVEGRPWTSTPPGPTLPTGMDRNEPLIGSGSLFTPATAGVPGYSLQGTAYDPGGSVGSVTNSVAGLYRRKYVGQIITAAGNPNTWDLTFTSNPAHGPISTPDKEIDTVVSFGQRNDLPYEDHYSFEWKGYLQVPSTGTWNTYITCDDDVVMWIGSAALNPSKTNYHHAQAYVNQGVSGANPNSVTLTSGVWYPIRMWFVEYGGAERFQLFMNTSANSTKYSGSDLSWAHNSATKGY
jgi:hypothetical protein